MLYKFVRKPSENGKAFSHELDSTRFPWILFSTIEKWYKTTKDIFTKPLSDKCLPDLPKDSIPLLLKEIVAEKPKTFILNLNGTLVHQNYKMGKGYELTKRPGLDVFLKSLAQIGEVVIYSEEDLMVRHRSGILC